MTASSDNYNALAIQHFYLLPIEATAHPATADLLLPRCLGFFFLIAMGVGVCYTIYFIANQVLRFCVSYSSTGADWLTTEKKRAGYLEEVGVGDRANMLSNGHLRIADFALTWCKEDDAADVYQISARIALTLQRHEWAQELKPHASTQIKIDRLRSAAKITGVLTWLILCSQCLMFAVTFTELLESRVFVLYGTLQVFLRASFVIVIFLLAFNEISSIKYQEYIVLRGALSEGGSIKQMIQIMVRYMMTIFGLYTICIYVLTDDVSGGGSMMDQIKDFAAFVIIYDIDTIIMGPLFNNFFRPQDMELDQAHQDCLKEMEAENRDDVNFERRQKLCAIDFIHLKLGPGCSFIKVVYILRTFLFYPVAVYLECNFLWYAVIFITRADPPK